MGSTSVGAASVTIRLSAGKTLVSGALGGGVDGWQMQHGGSAVQLPSETCSPIQTSTIPAKAAFRQSLRTGPGRSRAARQSARPWGRGDRDCRFSLWIYIGLLPPDSRAWCCCAPWHAKYLLSPTLVSTPSPHFSPPPWSARHCGADRTGKPRRAMWVHRASGLTQPVGPTMPPEGSCRGVRPRRRGPQP